MARDPNLGKHAMLRHSYRRDLDRAETEVYGFYGWVGGPVQEDVIARIFHTSQKVNLFDLGAVVEVLKYS